MKQYYLLTVWVDAKKMGKEFRQFRRLKTAEKWLEKLKKSGRYEMIVLREETVYWDTYNSLIDALSGMQNLIFMIQEAKRS